MKYLVEFANDMLENVASENIVQEAADTAADEEVKAVKDISPIPTMILTGILCISLRYFFRAIKRLMRRY